MEMMRKAQVRRGLTRGLTGSNLGSCRLVGAGGACRAMPPFTVSTHLDGLSARVRQLPRQRQPVPLCRPRCARLPPMRSQEEAAKKKAEEEAAAAKGEEASSSEAAEAEVKELLAEATAAAGKEEAAEKEAAAAAAEASSSGDDAQVKSLEKAQTAAAKRAGGEATDAGGAVMKSQKDITLAKDLDLRDRWVLPRPPGAAVGANRSLEMQLGPPAGLSRANCALAGPGKAGMLSWLCRGPGGRPLRGRRRAARPVKPRSNPCCPTPPPRPWLRGPAGPTSTATSCSTA